MKTKRLAIYPKDLALITGKSERYARTLIKKMKTHFDKEDHQIITMKETSEYMGIPIEEISLFIH